MRFKPPLGKNNVQCESAASNDSKWRESAWNVVSANASRSSGRSAGELKHGHVKWALRFTEMGGLHKT